MGFRARSGIGGGRRQSRRLSYDIYDNFDEPSLANNGDISLKTTGQTLADFPDDNALTTLIDPERAQRKQGRSTPRMSRRTARAASESNSDETDAESGHREKLFLRLKRNLAGDPDTTYSEIRETPVKGKEDYRHNRVVEESPGKRKRHSSQPPRESRRARRSTRPAVYEYEPSAEIEQDPKESTEETDYTLHSEAKHRKLTISNNNILVKTKQVQSSPEATPPTGETPKSDAKLKGLVNNDYCNSCGGTGELLCCETCVRSFHFSCLEPPVLKVEEILEDEWSCRHCKPVPLKEKEKEAISKTFFAPLIIALESHNSVAYQLPTHIRELFAHVQTSKYGEYMDEFMKSDHISSGSRLQDKNGSTILCFRCQKSALNGNELATCSRCHEAWHIDCVDPPLESTPLGYWVCPLHAGNKVELPLRVKKPIHSQVVLQRGVANNGDIEVADDDTEAANEVVDIKDGDRESAGPYPDEEVTHSVMFPAQSRMLTDGSIVAKSSRIRPRGLESDRIVYKLPPKTIKLDFLDAVKRLRADPLKESPTSDFMLALDYIAEKPEPEREAVRNLMHLKLQGPAVNTATAKNNLNTLLDAALDDENEIGQIAAIRKLMKEKGKERLLQILKAN